MNESKKEITRRLEYIEKITETFSRYKNKLIEEKRGETTYKITPTKYHMLKMIYKKNSCMVVDVSRELELSSGATTIILNQLEDEGLITRLRSEDDRRIVWIKLSDSGKQLVEEMIRRKNQFLSDMFSVLSEDEKNQFFHLLEKMVEGVNQKIEK
ncbi:MarR family winged helix-turn-helix transcriptional regulator [Ectobacillus panaciterrae]|uniref:MarR family winged helix-turn-helix transcriptional regulator n=1 Tax=Ectobacillus panaciterrae TaxID=363872 RepID=UPI0003F97894|nr:MarR family transcriptional regulator [Ectobacillus panaciterrae]